MYNFGADAAVYIFVHIVMLVVTWWALQAFQWERVLKHPKSPQAKILIILFTIAISYLVSQFFLNYLDHSLILPNLFE